LPLWYPFSLKNLWSADTRIRCVSCRTRVRCVGVGHRHDTDTCNYIELCLKSLLVLTCLCQYLGAVSMSFISKNTMFKFFPQISQALGIWVEVILRLVNITHCWKFIQLIHCLWILNNLKPIWIKQRWCYKLQV
jgi:hypothetical protein